MHEWGPVVSIDVFVSVGTALSPSQEEFVAAVEQRLRALGLNPRTIGRNTFSADAPLRAVTDLMDECKGAVVIALERFRFPIGEERPGSVAHKELADVRMPTSWNQIEAAMAYSRGLPLLVIVDETVRADGLLEHGNDWFVQGLPLDPSALNSPAFVGILASWRRRLDERPTQRSNPLRGRDPASLTVGQLVASLKPAQLWASLGALVAALGVAFALGANLI